MSDSYIAKARLIIHAKNGNVVFGWFNIDENSLPVDEPMMSWTITPDKAEAVMESIRISAEYARKMMPDFPK